MNRLSILAESIALMAGKAASWKWILPMVLALVILGAMVAVFQTLRRWRVNRSAVWALLLFLGAWLFSMGLAALQAVLQVPAIFEVVRRWLQLILTLASTVLAVTGLMKSARSPGKYAYGRAQGIWALVLSGIMNTALLGVLIGTGPKGREKWIAALLGRKALSEAVPVLTGTAEITEFNFRFGQPAGPWIPTPLEKNPVAQFEYCQPAIGAFVAVIAERSDGLMTRQEMRGLLESYQKSRGISLTPVSEEDRKVEETTFLRVVTKVEGMAGTALTVYHETWLAGTTDCSYQLSFWGPWEHREILAASAKAWMDSFSLIWPAPDVVRKEER
ncbi:MAG: hypothetical protein V4726_19080 [Verrucomicrobiota bacterium]